MNELWLAVEPIVAGTMTGIIAWGLGQPIPKSNPHSYTRDDVLVSSVFLVSVARVTKIPLGYVFAGEYVGIYFGLALLGGYAWYVKGGDVTPDAVKALATLALGALVTLAKSAVEE